MDHDWDISMDWCRRCGRTGTEITDGDMASCDGLPGVVHARYKAARLEANALFGPIVERVLGEKLDDGEVPRGTR